MSRNHRALDRKRWAIARWQRLTDAGFRCEKCSRPGRLECHHRVPLESGGDAYEQSNLMALCRSCHFAATAAARAEAQPAEVRAWQRLIETRA